MAGMSIVQGRTLELPGDRRLRILEAGDLHGIPVLVFHPTPSSRLFVREHDDAAMRAGVRLIGFSRPGYGGSTPAPPGLRVVAEDAARVADAYDVDRFAVLGFSGGTPFAAATAALLPDRVRAVGLCAAVAPWREVDDPGVEFDTELADLVEVARRDLAAALEGVRTRAERELGPLLALDDSRLAARLREDADPPDDAVLTPLVAMSQAVSLREACWQDDETDPPVYDGLAFDEIAFGTTWDVDVNVVSAPAWIWQGSDDVVTPPAHGAWWAARLPHASLVVREGRGHLGSFEGHREEMLETLRDA
jgi:pimeloyl-ACP methyl ester carboxylesterase